jgi:hypothetical protein
MYIKNFDTLQTLVIYYNEIRQRIANAELLLQFYANSNLIVTTPDGTGSCEINSNVVIPEIEKRVKELENMAKDYKQQIQDIKFEFV